MKKEMSVFSSCIISLFLAVFLSPAKSQAISIAPFTDWNLSLNPKVITPASEAPGPPDGPLGRAEAKRAFGADADTGIAATISVANFTADQLVIKASAKVTNTSAEVTGVNASTSLNFSRIYKTTRIGSAGFFDVNVNGAVKGIMGTLTVDNPFFFPLALFNLKIEVNEVDASGVRVLPGPFAPAVDTGTLFGPPPSIGPSAWTGTPPDQGQQVANIDANFKTKVRFLKKKGIDTFIEVAGVFGVGASIQTVFDAAALANWLTAFTEFLEMEFQDPTADLTPAELILAAGAYIDLGTGDLTAKGMSGFADSDFFGSVHLAVEADNIPEPSTMLLLGSGLAGLAFFRRRRKAA